MKCDVHHDRKQVVRLHARRSIANHFETSSYQNLLYV